MAKIDLYKRWELIVRFLKVNPLSFEDLNTKLYNHPEIDKDAFKFSLRTFPRDIEAIAENFKIEIKYNRGLNAYEITEDNSDLRYDRLIEAYNIVNVLKQSDVATKYIFLDNRKSKGSENFNGIMHAIQNKLIITFEHHSFWNKEIKQRKCVPVAMKEAQARWYLLAYDLSENDFKTYGLERINNLVITPDYYRNYPTINVDEYFKHAYGIVINEPVAKIVLEFDNSQINYIKSLPFHHSQKITKESNKLFTVELTMQPTYDFRMEILKYGDLCEVIEPIALRNQMKVIAQNMLKKYKK
jgi:predicted DNA-binding transcriptional regulator YafY